MVCRKVRLQSSYSHWCLHIGAVRKRNALVQQMTGVQNVHWFSMSVRRGSAAMLQRTVL